MPSTHRFTIFADYFQFIVMDENSTDDFSTIWTDVALKQSLAVGKEAICPGTFRNVNVEVEIKLADADPEIDLTKYDHAVEASIKVPSGRLIIMGCTDYQPDASRIELPAGVYHVLSLAAGIETITTEWEPANDLYTVYLWPGEYRQPKIIKQWKSDRTEPDC
jgi:hypothetical protein